MLTLFRSKTAVVGHLFSRKVANMFSVRFIVDMFLDHISYLSQVHELVACVWRANDNAGNLISLV